MAAFTGFPAASTTAFCITVAKCSAKPVSIPNKPPKTWEELQQYAKKLTKLTPNGSYERIGFIPNYGNSWLYLYSWQNGGEFMSDNGRKCTSGQSAYSVGALRYMADFYDMLGGYDKVNIFQSGFQGEAQDPFFTGKIGMVINGSWNLDAIARYAPDLDFGIAPAPVPQERLEQSGRFQGRAEISSPGAGGFSLAIPRGGRHPQRSVAFYQVDEQRGSGDYRRGSAEKI